LIGVVPGCNVVGCGSAFNANAGQIDPSAKFSLSGGTLLAGSNPSLTFVRPVIRDFDSAMGRLDHSLGQNDKLTGRFEYDRFKQAAVFNPKLLVVYRDATHSITNEN